MAVIKVFDENYFDWLADMVDCIDYPVSDYIKILDYLYHREFTWYLNNDGNREADGFALRDKFIFETGREDAFFPPYCTVLEMMTALARRWEDNVMYDPDMGDRTHEWFWLMMRNLGLSRMEDFRFDAKEANYIIDRFLDREYSKDGLGGLFRIRNQKIDMRNTEIWYQMNYFFNEFLAND